jgi:hypothetical protein
MALVLKEWRVKDSTGPNDPKIVIIGRQAGLFGFLFSLIGIDPTTAIGVYPGFIAFRQGSWSGQTRHVTPHHHVCSTVFGYTKPWKEALLITCLLAPVFGIGLILGPLYYFLNKELSIGFTAMSGNSFGIAFKRSVIEGKSIGEEEGMRIAQMIQAEIDGVKVPYKAAG